MKLRFIATIKQALSEFLDKNLSGSHQRLLLCGVPRKEALKKAVKDRKINVETPASFHQEIFKRKANIPAIIWRAPNSGFDFRIKIGD